MKVSKKNLMPAIVLGAICLIVAALLAVINIFTAPKIEEQERLARTASLRAVFGGDASGADFDEPMTDLPSFGEGSYVTAVYKEKSGMGYAVLLTVPKGYEGEIGLTVGVDMNGKVTGVEITKYNDTVGKDKMPEAVKNFIGKTSAEDVDLVSGATFSSNAVKEAVEQAISAVDTLKSMGDPVKESISSVLGGASFSGPLKDIPELGETSVTAIYQGSYGAGYAVLTSVKDGNEEKLTLTVGTTPDGKIKKIIITSYGYSDGKEEIISAIDGFIGQTSADSVTLPEFEASDAVKGAIEDALSAVSEINLKKAELLALVGSLFPSEAGYVFSDPMSYLPKVENSTVASVYKEKYGSVYAVLLSVNDAEGEKLGLAVGIDKSGMIVGIKLTNYGFAEGEAQINAAISEYVGKTSANAVTLPETEASKSVKKAIEDALLTVYKAELGIARSVSEEDFLAAAKTMLPGASGFELVKELDSGVVIEKKADYRSFKIKVYKETSGKGYAVYGETYNEWTYSYYMIESSFFFTTDENFKIVDFKISGWSLSDSYQATTDIYVTDNSVKKLAESFIGADLMSFTTRVDLVTAATESSVRIESAVVCALEYLDEKHDTQVKIYTAAGAAALVAFIAAIGVAIYFQRRRRI